MAWYRIEGNMPQHEKYVPLSDSAFRLAITAGAWCASMMTDGRLPKKVIAGLTRAPAGKKLDESVAELVNARIWDRIEGDDSAFNVHDFLDWNMSRAQWKAKKDAGSAGGKAKAAAKAKQPLKQKTSKRLAPASDVLEQKPSTSSSVPLADSDSDSDSDSEDRSEKRSGDLPRLPDGKPTGKSDHQLLIDHYHDKFLVVRGAKPVVGGREAKAAKTLLDSVGRDLSRAIATIDNAYADQWWRDKVTILDIAGNPSRFITASLPAAKPERWGPGGGNGPQPNDPNNRYKAKGLDY